MAEPDKRDGRLDFIEFPAAPETIAPTKRFYGEAFGWSYRDWGPDFADTLQSGLASGLNANAAQRTKRPLAVIYASDLEAVLAKITMAGGRVTREIFAFPGGRRFHFKDPAGNELAVWSDVDATGAKFPPE